MQFFVVSGAPDACGKGCGRWIAAEGRIADDTVERLTRLLDRVGSQNLPIFFHSPGGDGYRAMALGRLLRARGISAGVGLTVPERCVWPDLEMCRQVIREHPDIHAILQSKNAICNSGCVIALVGAVKRTVEVPPAQLAVHSTFNASQVANFEIVRRRFDHAVEIYLAEMGIGSGLFKIIAASKFESPHNLTRTEMLEFGIIRPDIPESGLASSRILEQPPRPSP